MIGVERLAEFFNRSDGVLIEIGYDLTLTAECVMTNSIVT
jgi:hypothetical protein